jgi:hypothetical protein
METAIGTPKVEYHPELPEAPAAGVLLPLDAPARMATFRSGGKTYSHIFRRVTAKDWADFFSGIVAEFRQEGSGFSQVVDTDSASLGLYGKIIQRVEGYKTRDGSSVESLPLWQERIPQHHRLAAVELLMRATRSEADDSLLDVEGVTVTLDALWNETAPGCMQAYKGLVHHFSAPSAEHRRRFLKAKNRAFIAGGSRSGTTMIPSAHPVLIKLYDELIESAEGYSVAGASIGGREQIAREMDAVHKSVAVAQLFPTALRIDSQDSEKEQA